LAAEGRLAPLADVQTAGDGGTITAPPSDPSPSSGAENALPRVPLRADCVEKPRNRVSRKSGRSALRARFLSAMPAWRRWRGRWRQDCQVTRSPASQFYSPAQGSEFSGSEAKTDFFNTIRHKQTLTYRPETDISRRNRGGSKLASQTALIVRSPLFVAEEASLEGSRSMLPTPPICRSPWGSPLHPRHTPACRWT
jgi:hypothetical protein